MIMNTEQNTTPTYQLKGKPVKNALRGNGYVAIIGTKDQADSNQSVVEWHNYLLLNPSSLPKQILFTEEVVLEQLEACGQTVKLLRDEIASLNAHIEEGKILMQQGIDLVDEYRKTDKLRAEYVASLELSLSLVRDESKLLTKMVQDFKLRSFWQRLWAVFTGE